MEGELFAYQVRRSAVSLPFMPMCERIQWKFTMKPRIIKSPKFLKRLGLIISSYISPALIRCRAALESVKITTICESRDVSVHIADEIAFSCLLFMTRNGSHST